MSVAMPTVDPQVVNDAVEKHEHAAEPREFVAPNGRLRVDNLNDSERHYAVLLHLSPLATFIFPIAIIAPFVLWLVRKDQSRFNDDHGKEVVNFIISFIVLHILLALACVTIIGIPLALVGIPVLWIAGLVGMIRGAIAASNGEYFRYPMTIRFLT